MYRSAILFVLAAGFFSTAAYWSDFPAMIIPRTAAVNSTVAPVAWVDPATTGSGVVDAANPLHVLLFNYSVYDSAYARKVRRFVQQHLPATTITEFWDGNPADLTTALADVDAVVVAYPAHGQSAQLRAYGKALAQYVRNGGAVVLTGTNEYSVLQQLGLIELDFGYFCDDQDIHAIQPQHPVLTGLPENLHLTNFAYPLDVSDPAFVTLGEIRDYPVLGYKAMGAGKVVYLGVEYYYNEPNATRLLANAIGWAVPARSEAVADTSADLAVATAPASIDAWTPARTVVKRTEERLFTGSSRAAEIDLKIYPNPYFSKATVELELAKAAPVAVEMIDETGRQAALLLPQRTLSTGTYRFELPNVPPGVYFVHCKIDGQVTVKKVVKTEAQ